MTIDCFPEITQAGRNIIEKSPQSFIDYAENNKEDFENIISIMIKEWYKAGYEKCRKDDVSIQQSKVIFETVEKLIK